MEELFWMESCIRPRWMRFGRAQKDKRKDRRLVQILGEFLCVDGADKEIICGRYIKC